MLKPPQYFLEVFDTLIGTKLASRAEIYVKNIFKITELQTLSFPAQFLVCLLQTCNVFNVKLKDREGL